MNDAVRRKIWPAWLDGQMVAVVATIIAFGALVQTGFSSLRCDINELRGDMNQQINALRGDTNQQIRDLRGELSEFRGEVREEFGQVDVRLRAIETELAVVGTRLDAVERHVGIVGSSPTIADSWQKPRRAPD